MQQRLYIPLCLRAEATVIRHFWLLYIPSGYRGKGFSPVRSYTQNTSSVLLYHCPLKMARPEASYSPRAYCYYPSFEFCSLFRKRECVPQFISTTEMLCTNLVPKSEIVLAVCRGHGNKEKSTHN